MILSVLAIVMLPACTGWFGGADTAPDSDNADAAADTADSGTDAEAAVDDARVRALTDLPEGDHPCRDPLVARVSHITDGDTVYVRPDDGSGDFKVRMIGIDTPEIEHDDPAECYGPEAMAFTAEQISGRLVWLTFDEECLDVYDRSLAYLFRDSGETGFYNRVLARQGYARALTIEPDTTYADEFEADVAAAKKDSLGMWEGCP